MKREIKFRAWKKSQETMFYPIKTIHPIGLPQVMLDVDDDELMQYTGLKDSNGQEIYEGDIVQGTIPCLELDGSITYYTKVIEHVINERNETYGHGDYGKTIFSGFKIGDYLFANGECEVIGNIYENPELNKTV